MNRGAMVAATLLLAGTAMGQTPASVSLEKCQKTAQKETAKYANGLQKALSNCLQKIAVKVVKGNQESVDVSGATNTCLAQFYKVGRGDGKSLADKMSAKITAKCDPGKSEHSEADLLGTGGVPGVNQPLNVAAQLGGYCARLATGAGTLAEWIECLQKAAECEVNQQIAVEFPRALQWLDLMDDQFTASTKSDKAPHAQEALQATNDAIEGATDDDVAEIACPAPEKCGNRMIDAGEQCDFGDLNGQTCESQTPAAPVGTLACNPATCQFDTSECLVQYVDNGNQTVTDNETELTWEKKTNLCASGCPINFWNDIYTWSATSGTPPDGTTFTEFLDQMNGGEGAYGCFADYCDWRLPTVGELETIVDTSVAGCGSGSPCIDPIFGPTASSSYWSSTTDASYTLSAGAVSFYDGSVDFGHKTDMLHVRAVRGGL